MITFDVLQSCQHFLAYGPSYQLAVTTGPQPDLNTNEDLKNAIKKALGT